MGNKRQKLSQSATAPGGPGGGDVVTPRPTPDTPERRKVPGAPHKPSVSIAHAILRDPSTANRFQALQDDPEEDEEVCSPSTSPTPRSRTVPGPSASHSVPADSVNALQVASSAEVAHSSVHDDINFATHPQHQHTFPRHLLPLPPPGRLPGVHPLCVLIPLGP